MAHGTKMLANRGRIIFYGLFLLVNVVVFSFTRPLDSPALVVIVGFLVAATDMIIALSLLVRLATTLMPSLVIYKKRMLIVFGAASIVTLALSSIGQLTWRDEIVVLSIVVIGYLYSIRLKLFGRQPQ